MRCGRGQLGVPPQLLSCLANQPPWHLRNPPHQHCSSPTAMPRGCTTSAGVDAPHAGGWGGLEAAENAPDGNTGVLLSVPDGAPSLGCLSRLLYSEAAQSTGNTPVRCWALGGLVGQGGCKLPTSPFPPGSR
jgi:hypothetical protein